MTDGSRDRRATGSRAPAPPRAMAWVVLLASAGAVTIAGLLATVLILNNSGGWPSPPPRFWLALAAACALTIVSISLRSLRWIYLLRRAETRIPIRDAYIGYFAGFSLLFVPLLVGEIAVRAAINRKRGGVPPGATAVVNVWERLLDFAALGAMAAATNVLAGVRSTWVWTTIAGVIVLAAKPVRVALLAAVRSVLSRLTVLRPMPSIAHLRRLAFDGTWFVAFATSVVSWLLPGIGLWLIALSVDAPLTMTDAERVFTGTSVASGLTLVPGGVLITGRQMIASIEQLGTPATVAVLIVLAIRLATVGVSILLGAIFAAVHLRSAAADSAVHFDDIADAYDVQIPESRRHALLEKKTALMSEAIRDRGIGSAGLDVGCGQGAYVARMRELGFDVRGIDASQGQVAFAGKNVGDPSAVSVGSVLSIPAADASFDFLYIINVLHHLGSIDEQRRAFAELLRVLKPGGVLFVHEINTRNVVFRFYMGYVFPSLNCIDEGVERWLLPHRLADYTEGTVSDVRYFTFLPDFIPQAIARWLSPIERWLERSTLAPYSAHYMAVVTKAPRRST